MIIECQAGPPRCQRAKSRIKGKGPRIRCRKCGESIIVMKSDIPPTPPSPPAAKDLFDLRAILDAPEQKAARSSRDEVDAAFDKIFSAEPETGPVAPREEKAPAPPEEKAQDEFAQKPEEPRGTPAPLSREEVDTAFDELLREDPEPETISQKPPESAPPRDEFDAALESPLFAKADLEPPPPPETEEPAPDRGFPDAPFPREPEKEEKHLFPEKSEEIGPPERSIEELFRTPQPAKEGSEPAREPRTPLELDESTSDYLRMNGVPAEPAPPLATSEPLGEAPLWSPGGEMPSADLAPEPIPRFEEAPSPRMEAIQEELADLAEKRRLQEEARRLAPPPPAPPSQIPPRKTPSLKLPGVERPPASARRRPTAPSKRPSTTLLVLLLITLAGGGAYLAILDPELESLHSIFSAVEYFRSGGNKSVQAYKVENLAGFYETDGKAGKRFVVEGMITSQGPEKTSGIRVRAELLDKSNQTIAEKTGSAGNIIPALNPADREHMEAA